MNKFLRLLLLTILIFCFTAGASLATSPNRFKDRSLHTVNLDTLRIADGQFPFISYVHRFGRNSDIDTASGFEAIWNGGGFYTGFNATVAETLQVFSAAGTDAGTLLSSGTATGGSSRTLIDTGATFVTDTVAIGDIVLNDTQTFHGIVKAVTSETVLTVIHWDNTPHTQGGHVEFAAGDTYRVATPASTGLAVLQLNNLLDGDLCNETQEYIILNGTTAVETVGQYRRGPKARGVLGPAGDPVNSAITIRQKTTTANIFAVLPPGANSTTIAAHTIPCEQDAYLSNFFVGFSGKVNANSNVRLRTRHPGEPFVIREELSLSGAGTGYVSREYSILKNDLSPGTDIVIEADTDSNDTGIAAGFDIMLVTEE